MCEYLTICKPSACSCHLSAYQSSWQARLLEKVDECTTHNPPRACADDWKGEIEGRRSARPGHTPGHMAVSIISGSKQLLCVGDALIHPIHVERPEWYLKYDLVPRQNIETRRQLLARAATGKVLVHAFHFPFSGLGYVVQKGKSWQWQTMSTHPK